jgi:ribonuclease P protein component
MGEAAWEQEGCIAPADFERRLMTIDRHARSHPRETFGSVLGCAAMSDPVSQPRRYRFPATRRLKRSRDFERVRKEGRTLRGALLTLGVLQLEKETGFKIGIVTSRRLGGAVVRNRVRRRLREIVRRRQHEMSEGVWLVIIARPPAATAKSAALEREWLRLTRRVGVLSDSCSGS